MKGIKLFFAGCLGLLVSQAAIAVDNDDTVRAAVRRDATTTSNARQKSGAAVPATKSNSRGGRATSNTTSSAVRERATATKRTSGATNVTPRTTVTRNVSERNQTIDNSGTRTPRNTNTANVSRTATTRTVATTGARATTTRTAAKSGVRKSRAATSVGITGAISANYAACRKTYYDCMDEFCANKDSQLRRCSCSSRVHEFDDVKKQLSRVEDKMLDFNQRLLTVNMDAEDVQAMMTSTEGEDAYYDTTDKTKSKQMLDDIAKKLNKTFGEDATTGMGAISLSLNADSVFDSIDSFMGSDTTTKNGVELYRAALPVCREMVLETCSAEELSLAESGYQMQIEQDCTTVAKSYQSQTEQARAKVLESSALLDISRLDVHQKRNSDDILTCKKKMLDMLTDTTVCGDKMGKCLDITGQYVDPTTGKAFLTENLGDLATLITRPGENESWVKLSANQPFVNFLEDKKDYLKPAMENCQDIADTVWDSFLPDALAQIKLAQDAKLEEVRQACTTLVSECLVGASDSIDNFDARSLSVFGVSADLTANTMCTDVKKACTTLLATNADAAAETTTNDWGTGIADITTNKTYETILSSCTQVGRNCIIEACKSINGNFGLCDSITTSPNRHSILTRTSCWSDVMNCVANAGDDSIRNIMKLLGKDTADTAYFYDDMYFGSQYIPEDSISWNDDTWTPGMENAPLLDLCSSYCDTNNFDIAKCGKCRLTERIWGNCQATPSVGVGSNSTNYILKPNDSTETLMYWFAKNTGTENDKRACTNLRCLNPISLPSGATGCGDSNQENYTSGDGRYCPAAPTHTTEGDWWTYSPVGSHNATSHPNLFTPADITYSTDDSNIDFFRMFGNNDSPRCCWSMQTQNGNDHEGQWTVSGDYNTGEFYLGQNTCCKGSAKEAWDYANGEVYSVCLPTTIHYYSRLAKKGKQMIICVPTDDNLANSFSCEKDNPSSCSQAYNGAIYAEGNYPHGKTVRCHGTYVLIDATDGNDSHKYSVAYNTDNFGNNKTAYGISDATKYCPNTATPGMISYTTLGNGDTCP